MSTTKFPLCASLGLKVHDITTGTFRQGSCDPYVSASDLERILEKGERAQAIWSKGEKGSTITGHEWFAIPIKKPERSATLTETQVREALDYALQLSLLEGNLRNNLTDRLFGPAKRGGE